MRHLGYDRHLTGSDPRWSRRCRRDTLLPVTSLLTAVGELSLLSCVALGRPAELLRSVELWDVAAAIQVVQLGAVDDIWNKGGSGVFTMLAQLSPYGGGESIEGCTAIVVGRAESWTRLDGNILSGGVATLRSLAE